MANEFNKGAHSLRIILVLFVGDVDIPTGKGSIQLIKHHAVRPVLGVFHQGIADHRCGCADLDEVILGNQPVDLKKHFGGVALENFVGALSCVVILGHKNEGNTGKGMQVHRRDIL